MTGLFMPKPLEFLLLPEHNILVNGFLGQVPIRGLGQNAPPWTIEGEIERKRHECDFLSLTYDSAFAKYHQEDTPSSYYEEILMPAWRDLEACTAELQELVDTADFGPRIPEQIARIPFTWNEPTSTTPLTGAETSPGEPATAAPAPVSAPTTEPAAEPVHCDPMKGQFMDLSTGQCRGSVKPGFSSFSAVGPTVTSFMSGGRIQAEPLRAGRF